MRVDLARVRVLASSGVDLTNYIKEIFGQCTADDPPFISDFVGTSNANNGGVFIMQALEARYNACRDMPPEQRARESFLWKLHVVRDEWGNEGLPGDVITFWEQKPLDHAPGVPASSRELTDDKINGVYREKWMRRYDYTVDERGCITCEFLHAARFLNLWGIHSKSGAILSRHKTPNSAGPKETAVPGQKLHVWYHRYKEADREYYENLPILRPRGSDEPRRGRPKKDNEVSNGSSYNAGV